MKFLIVFMALLALGTAAFAEDGGDREMADRIAAANGRLANKKAASTQAAVSDDPVVLRGIILEQKQQIESLKATVGALTRDLASTNYKLQPAAMAPAAAQTQPADNGKRVVVSAREFKAMAKGGPAGFPHGWVLDAVGYIPTVVVKEVIDESTALVGVSSREWSGNLVEVYGQVVSSPLIIEGVPTRGQVDNNGWTLNGWFKIVATRKFQGTTYFVAQPIVQGPPQRPGK
jgi:hypothetical protein